MTVQLVCLLVGSYILGSIPFGVLVARSQGIDIMSIGSGNTGATNVMRALGKGPGLLVFFLDLLKGLLPALAGRWLFPDRQEFWFLAGICAVLGHSLSPFLGFRGGKGISSALGMTVGTSPFTALGAFVIFSSLLGTTRFMSLASMIGVASTVPLSYFLGDSHWVTGGYVLLTIFVVIRHRANIDRLRKGTEPKFTFKKTIQKPADDEDNGGGDGMAGVGAVPKPPNSPLAAEVREEPPGDESAS